MLIVYWVRKAVTSLLVARSLKERRHGLTIVDLTDDVGADAPIARVRAAIDLIVEVDPRRASALRQELRQIIVTNALGPAYWPFASACALPRSFVLAEQRGGLAATIVHELTHARLWRLGFRYEKAIRGRAEHLCVREQIRFARKLPEGPRIVEHLENALKDEWWSARELRARNRRSLKALLRRR